MTKILNGKTVVFTGTMKTKTRAEHKKLAEVLGATLSAKISVGVDYVVAGIGAGSNVVAARDLGINILSESEWLDF